jgi:hypothetical protein
VTEEKRGTRFPSWVAASREYKSTPERLSPNRNINRELNSKQRALEYLASEPMPVHIERQWLKLWDVLLNDGDTFHLALGRKTLPASAHARLAPWAALDITYWQLLIWASCLGLPLLAWQNAGWAFVASFFVYYLFAFSFVSFSGRFALQLAPALCLLSVGAVATVASWAHASVVRLRTRRAPLPPAA